MFTRVEEHCSFILAVLVFVLVFVLPVLCLRELRNIVRSYWRCWFCLACVASIMFTRVEEHCSVILAVLVFVLVFVLLVSCLRELRNIVPTYWPCWFCLACVACIMFTRVEEHCSHILAVLVFVLLFVLPVSCLRELRNIVPHILAVLVFVLFVLPVLCLRELRNIVPIYWRCWFLSCCLCCLYHVCES